LLHFKLRHNILYYGSNGYYDIFLHITVFLIIIFFYSTLHNENKTWSEEEVKKVAEEVNEYFKL